MLELKRIQTDQAPHAIGPYSQAMVSGNLVFTAGQIPLDPPNRRADLLATSARRRNVCWRI